MSETDRELIDRWLDGELRPDEEVSLASQLETDAEAVAYLARRAQLHSALRQAFQRSALQQKALAMVEFPPSPERHDLVALPRRRWRPTKANWAAAMSLVVLVVGGSVMWLGQAKASPSALVRQALQAHSARLDRCYRVEIQAESGRREAAGARLVAQPETLLWTRGDRFWNQIRVGEQSVAWGRDEQGGVWFTLSPDAGARLAQDEVPDSLALACELRSLELESLLRSILADFDLRREPAGGGTDRIHAELKEGRTHPRYRSALLELDSQSHVLRRVVLHRAHNGRAVAAVEFTLVMCQAKVALFVGTIVLVGGAASFAQDAIRKEGDVSANPLLKKFDRNGDGTIDDEERQTVREKLRQMRTKPGAMTPSGKTETIGNREVTELEYASSDGRKIPCVLSMPKGDGPFPVLVTIHGGQGNRDLGYIRTMAAPNQLSPTVAAFNEQPWAILAISYRAGNGALFGMEQDDVVAGIRFAKTLPKTDPARVGVIGGSHGGHLALVAAEKMGQEFLCVAAGSPWMTDPVVYMTGDPNRPPLSLVPAKARDDLVMNGRHLFWGLTLGRGMSEQQAKEFIAQHSIEANADKIVVPSLFITSRGDDQAPHVLIEPMIKRMKAAGKDVTVYTAEKSPHGFYWARTVSAARALRGEKSPEELAEETAAREHIIAFLKKQFARTDVPFTKTPEASPGNATNSNTRRTLASSQADAVRKLRSRLANMPVPENLTRRTLNVGGKEREFFIHVPEKVKGKPAPVVFALHGGATSTGLAMHVKADFTKLGDAEGYVTVYPSGVNGWNIGSHDAYSVKRRTSDADDLGFFRAMFDTLIKEGLADPKRIYVTGGSNGGVMTQFLVCHLADRIAGAGVVVATLPRAAERDWPKPSRPVPILVMLGTVDPMKPWKGNRDQMSADETIAFWRKQNACTADGKKWDLPDRDADDGCRVHAQRWEGKAPVVFYTMEGHGHGWPMQRGRDETGTGPKTRDISAPEEFWKFFQSVDKSTSSQPTAKP